MIGGPTAAEAFEGRWCSKCSSWGINPGVGGGGAGGFGVFVLELGVNSCWGWVFILLNHCRGLSDCVLTLANCIALYSGNVII